MGHNDVLKLLLERRGMSPSLKDSMPGIGGRMAGRRYFMLLKKGHESVIRTLLEHGVDINSMDSDGHTALMLAASQGSESVLRLLLNQERIDVSCKSFSGATPLTLAASRGHTTNVGCISGTHH
jgi:ankyrin repeat protein